MSNQQIFPASSYPVTGDVQSTPGSPSVVVQGIQQTPVDPTPPQPQQILIMGSDGQWHPEDPIVSGPDAVGNTPSRPPVQVGGIDDGNLVRELRTDTYGGLRSIYSEDLLLQILLELRGIKAAILNLDNTVNDLDYQADNFADISAGV
jgi:hypothetical protein